MGQTDRTLPPSRIPSQPVTLPFIHAITHVPPSAPTHDNEIDSVMLGDNLQDLYLGRTNRFFGKASAVMVHQVTIKLKRDYMASTQGSPVPDLPPVRPVSSRLSCSKTYTDKVVPPTSLQIRLMTLLHTHFQRKTSSNPSSSFTSPN